MTDRAEDPTIHTAFRSSISDVVLFAGTAFIVLLSVWPGTM